MSFSSTYLIEYGGHFQIVFYKNPTIMQWNNLSLKFDDKLHDSLLQQHHASQFIALAGKHLIPATKDDSHTNMQYISETESLLGNSLPGGKKISLDLPSLRISIIQDEDKILDEIELHGKTKTEVFDELKISLEKTGTDVSGFTNQLHYDIPSHPLDHKAVFNTSFKNHFLENTIYRHNADLLLKEIVHLYPDAEALRIWPHHFDTGSFIALSKDSKGELSQSISFGWAIPDSMIPEPYFYLSFWSKNKSPKKYELPDLPAGKWMIPEWNGAVLPHSKIQNHQSSQSQFELSHSFFVSGISILLHYLK